MSGDLPTAAATPATAATAATAATGAAPHPDTHSHTAGLPASASSSAMSAPRDKFEVLDESGPVRHQHRNWKKIAAAIAAIVVILALALGLGLGLGLKKHHNGGGNAPSCTDTPDPTLCPNVTAPNSSVPTLAATLPWQIVLSETLVLANDTTTSDSDDEDSDSSDSDSTELVTPNAATSTNVTLYDIDMFAHQNNSVVSKLRAQGMHVICYFSAGSYEPDRPDSWKFTDDDKGNELDGWPGEYWLDLNSLNVRQIMLDRIDIAAQMNCSGIDPDNVDGYDNDNGLDLSEDDSISFMKFLATSAASRGLMTGLKNAAGIIDDVLDYVQFSVNEQCVEYDECDTFDGFSNASKPVFHIEYPAGDDDTDISAFNKSIVSQYCDVGISTGADAFNTVIKYMNLSGWVQYCDDQTYITDGY